MTLAISKNLWAPKVTPTRGRPWIIWTHVSLTRRDSRLSYLSDMDSAFHKDALSRVTFVRVSVVEQEGGAA